MFSPLFVYLNKLDRSSFDHAFALVRFSYKKIRLFLCLFALKSPLFCFQVLIRCNHKQTVWHWQARHQLRVNMISKLSKLYLEVSILWNCCLKILYLQLCCIFFHWFCFKTYFLPVCHSFYNIFSILVIIILWPYFNPTFAWANPNLHTL